MSNESNNRQKDRWDKFQIGAQVFIALAASAFTVVFGLNQQKNADATLQLALANFELARSQVKVSLLPSLSSEDARQRAMSLSLAKALDERFAADVASVLAVSDVNEGVRERARVILGGLSQSERNEVRQKAEKGANQYDIMNELRTRGLLKKLSDARGYIEGGSPGGIEEALKLYHEVVDQLSDSALGKLATLRELSLDLSLLHGAREDEKGGYKEHAARKYRALFQDYGG